MHIDWIRNANANILEVIISVAPEDIDKLNGYHRSPASQESEDYDYKSSGNFSFFYLQKDFTAVSLEPQCGCDGGQTEILWTMPRQLTPATPV